MIRNKENRIERIVKLINTVIHRLDKEGVDTTKIDLYKYSIARTIVDEGVEFPDEFAPLRIVSFPGDIKIEDFEELKDKIDKSLFIPMSSIPETKIEPLFSRNYMISNYKLWEFLGNNNLYVSINKNSVGTWIATLYNGTTHNTCSLRDCGTLRGLVGEGFSPEEAFDDFVDKYSGKLMYFENWDKGEYKPVYIQFPLIIREG